MEDEFDIIRFGRDLTAEARAGKLPPIIGRNEIIARVMEVLGRQTKNNPILVGEPGVGKTAIVEGLAQIMVGEKCPSWLKGKQLMSLEMAALIAGTRARGDFEARLKQLADFLKSQGGRILMFFDEMHQLVNLGREGSVDAANFFKPMLARGEIPCIGATTFEEYRLIEKDGAFARRYIMVRVEEPLEQETLAILRGLRERFESHHGVRIQDDALQAAIDLTNRYVTDRRQPDKAIDVLDEACAYLKANGELPPARIREIDTAINQLRIEEGSLRREGGEPLARVRSEIKRLEREQAKALEGWNEEISNREKYASLLRKKDECMARLDAAERAMDLERTVKLRLSELQPITSELLKLENVVTQHRLDAALVGDVVARMTRIRPAGSAADAKARLNGVVQTLLAKWPHQKDAIYQVRDGLARAFAGIAAPHRPLLNAFIKVAKDELVAEFARSIAAELCDGTLVSADMREYSERSAITKLIGAPPAYTGFETSTHLLEKVRQRSYCVVLFQNMDQAHEEVARLVMSVIADGVLTDGMGRPVTFRHAIVFLAGGESDRWGCDFEIEMKSPGAADWRSAVQFWIRDLQTRLQPRVTIECSDDTLEALAQGAQNGLAEIRQTFRRVIETPIANALIEEPSSHLTIKVKPDLSGIEVQRSDA